MTAGQFAHRAGLAGGCVLASRLLEPLLDRPGEFMGGWLTSPLFRMADIAWLLFLVAVLVTFIRFRAAAIVALVACALWAPLIVYYAARGIWDTPRVVGVLTLAATTYAGVRGLRRVPTSERRRSLPDS